MFLAGLYVGLGSFGNPLATLVSRGSFPGIGGGGIGLGPLGCAVGVEDPLDSDSNDVLLLKSFALNFEIGELCVEEKLDDLDSGLFASTAPFVILSLANRSVKFSPGPELLFVAAPVDIALPCKLSGFGEGVGRTFGAGGAPFKTLPLI